MKYDDNQSSHLKIETEPSSETWSNQTYGSYLHNTGIKYFRHFNVFLDKYGHAIFVQFFRDKISLQAWNKRYTYIFVARQDGLM